MKSTLLKINLAFSYCLDLLILVYFCIVFFIVFFGGFSGVILGNEFSATSAPKPVGTLLILFTVKLFVADLKKETEKKKVLLSGSFLVIFFTCEFLARVYYSVFVPQDLFWASKNMVMKRAKSEKLYFIDAIKLSNNKSITYEFLPDFKGYLVKWPEDILLKINQMGFRDDEEKTFLKDKGKFRIIGIGDSIMVGQGVKFKDTYGEVLENQLNLRSKNDGLNVEFEFINLAVPGYNTTMEVETFFKKGLRLNPDLVIISYVENDFDLPNFIIKKENPWISKKSYAVFYIAKRLNILASTKYGKFFANQKKDLGLWGLDMAMWRNVKLENPIGNEYEFVPDDYRFMVGIDAYIREMKRLKKKCDELELPLILQFDVPKEKIMEDRENIVIKTAKELNIPIVIDHEEVKKFLQERNASLEFFCVLRAAKTVAGIVNDCHPNKWGHLIKGKKLASFVYSNYISTK